MNDKEMNASQFSESIGVQRSIISHIMSKRKYNPSLDIVTKILNRFPEINPDWLLFGNGDMKREKLPSPDIIENKLKGKASDLFSQPLNNRNSTAPLSSTKPQNKPLKPSNFNANSRQATINFDNDNNYRRRTDNSNNTAGQSFNNNQIENNQSNTISNRPQEIKKEMINQDEINQEIRIHKEKTNKKIDKIMIFFSDNTFETFISE
jgi:hypothetical protein